MQISSYLSSILLKQISRSFLPPIEDGERTNTFPFRTANFCSFLNSNSYQEFDYLDSCRETRKTECSFTTQLNWTHLFQNGT